MTLTVETSLVVGTAVGQVHVSRAGHGDRALLAVTPIGEAWMTAALPAGLEELFTVQLMELPGTGRSTRLGRAPSVPTMIEAISAVAAELGQSPILFGHSMNGTLTLAAANPSACAGVIAVAPPPCLPPDPQLSTAYWEAHADSGRRRRGRDLMAAYQATSDATERSSIQERFDRLRRWHDLDFDPTDLDRLLQIDMSWVESVSDSGQTVDWAKTMNSVACPVLLALGESDFVAPPSAWTDDNIPPKTTVHLFKASGHTPYFEQADEFMRVTQDWLARSNR